ncbi:CGNR zinc finger domain-containing protein [Amycolatopsis sp. NBC_01307]|uniref:CGNR zinc finger domain-containing protein n=1 Tax=Amycolatopsis sp. NBC_01307 TaxID=2903561 RepID=UPI002E1294F3|nr:CGNR zinc finger domain-containing protein [Amycolatopsis sp. NBC_01307]
MNIAVADLTLVEQFLNTLDQRTFRWHGEKRVAADRLTSVEALYEWLEEHDLVAEGQRLRPADLAAAVALRTALREALTDGAARALAEFPLRLAPDPAGGLRVTADSGVPGLDPILETVAVNVASGGWHRLKLCAAEDCRWAFHDTSRNGGGRWCTMEACGNRTKTRAYRRRTS